MDNKQDVMWDVLLDLSSEEVLRAFTNYHGLQLLDDGFYEFLQDEGFIEEDDDCGEDDDIESDDGEIEEEEE